MLEFVGSTLVPSEVRDADIAVNEAYPNLRIGYMPSENRADHSADKPFALLDQMGGFVIKELSTEMAKNAAFILRWLYENDEKRHGAQKLYDKFLNEKAAVETKRKKDEADHLRERAEVAHAIASSPLHTYRINGRKLGADNEFPTLGIQ